MFNEGYSAHEGAALVRQDLCFEALRLGRIVAASPLAEPRAAPVNPSGGGRVAITTALLIAFCWLLPLAGYPIAAFLFVALLLRGLGAGWASAGLIALCTAGASHYAFGTLLGVPLPAGALFG